MTRTLLLAVFAFLALAISAGAQDATSDADQWATEEAEIEATLAAGLATIQANVDAAETAFADLATQEAIDTAIETPTAISDAVTQEPAPDPTSTAYVRVLPDTGRGPDGAGEWAGTIAVALIAAVTGAFVLLVYLMGKAWEPKE